MFDLLNPTPPSATTLLPMCGTIRTCFASSKPSSNPPPPGHRAATHSGPNRKRALLQALVLYLMHEAPKEEQNFAMVMEMLAAAEVREEDEEYESPLDILFARLEMRDRRALP